MASKRILTPQQMLEEQIAIDPLSPLYPHYKPSPTQAAFHKSDAYYKLLLGGGRAGKSSALMVELAWLLRGIHPYKKWCGPFTAVHFGVSRQQLAMVTNKKLLEQCELLGDKKYPKIGNLPLIPPHEIAHLGSIMVGFRSYNHVVMKNGCELWMASMASDSTWERIQGVKAGLITIDENAVDESLMIELYKRCQDSQHAGTWHGSIIWAGHGTSASRAFSDYRKRCEKGDNGHAIFHLQTGETGAVTAEATARFASILTDDQKKIHIDATEDRGDVQLIFRKQWDEQRLTTKVPFVLQDDDNIWASYDPGVSHPSGLELSVIRRGDPVEHIIKCWNVTGRHMNWFVEQMQDFLGGRSLAGFIYDTNLRNHDNAGGPSLLDQMKEMMAESGIKVLSGYHQSKKNHETGINLMREQMINGMWLLHLEPADRGVSMLVDQLVRYRGREATRFTGEGGIIKREDELCLVAGTMVQTDEGPVPIENVMPGKHRALTRDGFRTIAAGGITSFAAQTYRLVLADGHEVCATAGHRFWVVGKGWTRLDCLRYHDMIATCNEPPTLDAITTSSLETQALTTKTGRDGSCTALSGKRKSAQFLRATTSTTGMATPQTMPSTTSSAYRHKSMLRSMSDGPHRLPGMPPLYGMDQQQDWIGTRKTERSALPSGHGTTHAHSAGRSALSPASSAGQGSAVMAVKSNTASPVALITSPGNAPSAGLDSPSINTSQPRHAAAPVAGVFLSSIETVYDLTVPGSAEFFANGMLCHNCDTRRYKIMCLADVGRGWSSYWACGPSTQVRIEQEQAITDADPIMAALRERGRAALEYRARGRRTRLF